MPEEDVGGKRRLSGLASSSLHPPGADADDMMSVLRQTDQQARKRYSDGWILREVFISSLSQTCPSFRERFHPSVRLQTFLKQSDLFERRQAKGNRLYLRLRNALPH